MADRDRDLTDATGLLMEQAQRQLSQQSADLDTLRTRAIAMLSVAALAAALFGSRLPHGLSTTAKVAVIFALIFFAVSVWLAVYIVAPKKQGWRFTSPLGALIKEVKAGEALPMDIALSLAAYTEDGRKQNQEKIENLYALFRIVCVLVGLQVAAWVIAGLL